MVIRMITVSLLTSSLLAAAACKVGKGSSYAELADSHSAPESSEDEEFLRLVSEQQESRDIDVSDLAALSQGSAGLGLQEAFAESTRLDAEIPKFTSVEEAETWVDAALKDIGAANEIQGLELQEGDAEENEDVKGALAFYVAAEEKIGEQIGKLTEQGSTASEEDRTSGDEAVDRDQQFELQNNKNDAKNLLAKWKRLKEALATFATAFARFAGQRLAQGSLSPNQVKCGIRGALSRDGKCQCRAWLNRGPNGNRHFAGYEVSGFSFDPPGGTVERANLVSSARSAPQCIKVEQLCHGWPSSTGGCGIYQGETSDQGDATSWNKPALAHSASSANGAQGCFRITDEVVKRDIAKLQSACKETVRGSHNLTLAVLNGSIATTSKVEIWTYDRSGSLVNRLDSVPASPQVVPNVQPIPPGGVVDLASVKEDFAQYCTLIYGNWKEEGTGECKCGARTVTTEVYSRQTSAYRKTLASDCEWANDTRGLIEVYLYYGTRVEDCKDVSRADVCKPGASTGGTFFLRGLCSSYPRGREVDHLKAYSEQEKLKKSLRCPK